MAIAPPNDRLKPLIDALSEQFGGELVSFELRMAVDEVVTIKVETLDVDRGETITHIAKLVSLGEWSED